MDSGASFMESAKEFLESDVFKVLNSSLGLFVAVIGVLSVVVGPVIRRMGLSYALTRVEELEKTARVYARVFSGENRPTRPVEERSPGQRALDWFREPIEVRWERALESPGVENADLIILAEKHRRAVSTAYLLSTMGWWSILVTGFFSSLLPVTIALWWESAWSIPVALLLLPVSVYTAFRLRLGQLRKQASHITPEQLRRFLEVVERPDL